jgi:AraC-like DNA-binding protein
LFTVHNGIKQRGTELPVHHHGDAQLTFAASGVVQVHTNEGRWLVPPQLAAWIPPHVPHRIEALTEAELWVVHWQPAALRQWAPLALLARGAHVLRVTPLLRCLLEVAVGHDPAPAKTELVVRLMLHELTNLVEAPTFLPWPTSTAGVRLAEAAFADGQHRLGLGELAARAAVSMRTASRIFPAETGVTFKTWRQRARIVRANDRLARGDSIARVANAAGFSSTAAFSSAFRQVAAMTPTAFVAQSKYPATRE